MSTKPSLDGPRLKLRRAKQHLNGLKRSAKRFVDKEPCAFSLQPQPNGRYHYCGQVVAAPPATWSAMVGDSVHNARSALDLLAVQLARKNGKTHTGVSFPICVAYPDFQGNGRKAIKKLASKHRTAIQGLQPYHAATPKDTPLAELADLDNTDKHRALQFVFVAADLRGITMEFESRDPCPVNVRMLGDGVITERQTPILEIEPTNPAPNPKVEMRGNIPVRIFFGKGSPRAEGKATIPTIRGILNRVEEIIRQFEPEFP